MPSEEEFLGSLGNDSAPPGYSAALRALWWDMRGDWQQAHEIASSDKSAEAAWVHAYLHRKEGDRANARYWYSLAGKAAPHKLSLEEEAAAIRKTLLEE